MSQQKIIKPRPAIDKRLPDETSVEFGGKGKSMQIKKVVRPKRKIPNPSYEKIQKSIKRTMGHFPV